jgi:hypothetical protein
VRTKKQIYRQFIDFEERAARIYLRLASHFAAVNPKLSQTWLDMALEEKQHAGLLQFCLTDRLFTSDVPSETEIRKYEGLFRRLESNAADATLDVNGAFELALELEGSEVNAIYCHLTTPLHGSSYLLKRKIVTSPFVHVDELAAAGKKFGVVPRLQKKLDALKASCPNSFFTAAKPRRIAP